MKLKMMGVNIGYSNTPAKICVVLYLPTHPQLQDDIRKKMRSHSKGYRYQYHLHLHHDGEEDDVESTNFCLGSQDSEMNDSDGKDLGLFVSILRTITWSWMRNSNTNNDSSISPSDLKDYIIDQYDLDIHDIAEDLVEILMELLDADANGSIKKDEFKPRAKRWVEIKKRILKIENTSVGDYIGGAWKRRDPKGRGLNDIGDYRKVEVDILDEMGIVGGSIDITDTLVAISGCVQKSILDEQDDFDEPVLPSEVNDRVPIEANESIHEVNLKRMDSQHERFLRSNTLGRESRFTRSTSIKHRDVEEIEMPSEAYFVQIDGTNERIHDDKVIAATNRADILDPALMRSRRLDRKIEFPYPTKEARARIMQACSLFGMMALRHDATEVGSAIGGHLTFPLRTEVLEVVARQTVPEKTKRVRVTVTERAGQASEAMASMTNRELNSYNGVIAIILNGILLSRHKALYPPTPPDDDDNIETENDILPRDSTVTAVEPLISNEDESPLLKRSSLDDPPAINLSQDSKMSSPNERFQFWLNPSGSTDAIIICTTGVRDPMTSD
ncbi:ceramide kinase isoform X1 [Tanacetum coccineum]